MKTTTILFFVIVFAMNTGIAQPVNLLNKLIANQINGQIESVSTNVVNARFNNRFQYLLIDESNQLLQGPESILLDSVLVFSRYSETESWKIKSKTSYEYEFDNLNRLAKLTTNPSDREFLIINRFVYNNSGLLDSVICTWQPPLDKNDNFLVIDKRCYKHIYNEDGQIIEAGIYDLINSEWKIFMRLTFSYNELGKPDEIFMEEGWYFYDLNDNLLPSTHHFIYNENGKLVKYFITEGYDFQISYDWDINGNLKTETIGDIENNVKHKNMYSYDEHGNRILTEQYGLHNVSFWRFNTEKYEYMDLNYSNLINIDFWKIFGNEQDLTGYQPKNLVSKSYFNGYQYYGATSLEYINKEYFYSYVSGKQVLVGGINDRQNSDFKVFPNPTSGHVTFTWKTGYGKLNLKVFQLTGTCVMNRVINRNETINIEQLPQGIYLYMLSDKKETLNSGKLVIE